MRRCLHDLAAQSLVVAKPEGVFVDCVGGAPVRVGVRTCLMVVYGVASDVKNAKSPTSRLPHCGNRASPLRIDLLRSMRTDLS